MSLNIVRTIGHHTFRYDPPTWTEKGAPVKSKNNPETQENNEPQYKFLGDGYYFWDDNIEMAKRWGERQYKGKYKILECPLELKGENFLDLVGSRKDLRDFVTILNRIVEKWKDYKSIGKSLYLLQLMARYKPEVFPFTIIRSLDIKKNSLNDNSGDSIQYTSQLNKKMLLSPEIIICFYEKNDIPLHNARFI